MEETGTSGRVSGVSGWIEPETHIALTACETSGDPLELSAKDGQRSVH